jgi:hypothetical protein
VRLIKIPSLAVVAAMAAMAVAWASSASATELCKKAEAACNEASVYKGGTILKAEAKATKLLSGSGTIECAKSNAAGEILSEVGKPLPAVITELTFSECKALGFIGCTVTAVNLPYYTVIERTGEDVGKMTIGYKESKKKFGTTAVCSTFVNCTYTSEEIILDAKGGAPAELTASEENLFNAEGSNCAPKEVKWDGVYKFTAPESGTVHIAQQTTMMCTAEPVKGECPAGKKFGGKIEGYIGGFQPPGEIKSIEGEATGTITCEEIKMEGKVNEDGTTEITSHTYNNPEGKPCSSTLKEKPEVEVSVLGLPAIQSSFNFRKENAGILAYGGESGQQILLFIAKKTDCLYKTTLFSSKIVNPAGGNPMEVNPDWEGVLISGDSKFCPKKIKFEVRLCAHPVSGGKLWIAKK